MWQLCAPMMSWVQRWVEFNDELSWFSATDMYMKVKRIGKVSLLGVDSLWDDCTLIRADWGLIVCSRLVVFCSFWRLFTIKMIKSVNAFPFSFWKIILHKFQTPSKHAKWPPSDLTPWTLTLSWASAPSDLQLPLRQWGAGNVYLLVLSKAKR